MQPIQQGWGPIPELFTALSRSGSIESIIKDGGPWAVYTRELLQGTRSVGTFPAKTPEFARTVPQGELARTQHGGFWDWLRRLFIYLFRMLFPVAKPRAIEQEITRPVNLTLSRLIEDAYCWLAERNIEAAVSSLRSFPDAVPPVVTAITERAIFWALAVWQVVGSSGKNNQLFSVLSQRQENGPEGPPMEFADQLALHHCLERAIIDLSTEQWVCCNERVAGGLRRPDILGAAGGMAIAEPARWSLFAASILASPLTLIVYGDLASPGKAEAPTARLAFQRPNHKVTETWWADWQTLLARSLAALALSPPQVEEALATVEAQLSSENTPALSKPDLESEASQLRAKRSEQAVRRLQYLSELLAVVPAELGEPREGGYPNPSPQLAAAYVVARAWDMVVHAIVARQNSKIVQGWLKLSIAEPNGEAARDALLIGSDDGSAPSLIACDSLQILTQFGFDPSQPPIGPTESQWTYQDRERFFDLSLLVEPERVDGVHGFAPGTARSVVAHACGISVDELSRACERLAGTRDAVRVPIPVPPPNRLDRPPAGFIGAWARIVAIPPPSESGPGGAGIVVQTIQVPEPEAEV